MQILGLQKTTLLDYPGHVAATIFLGGCNMRCPFCHNMNLVNMDSGEQYTQEDILAFLSKRKGVLDGVCITGGEPTIHPELPDFIRSIKNIGLAVKLDTNGTNPQMLSTIIENNLVDYIAMDIKSSPKLYGITCGVPDISISNIKDSIKLIMSSGIDYEFRTTIVSEYHTPEAISEIGQLIQGAKHYYLQSFIDSEYVPDHSLSPLTKDTLIEYKDTLSQYATHVDIRGV